MDNKCNIISTTQSFNAYISNNNNNNNICEYKIFKFFVNDKNKTLCGYQNSYSYFEIALVSQCYNSIAYYGRSYQLNNSTNCNTFTLSGYSQLDCNGGIKGHYECEYYKDFNLSLFPFNVSKQWTDNIIPNCVWIGNDNIDSEPSDIPSLVGAVIVVISLLSIYYIY